jgi:8-oxo-dGTP pyrophosphatase MutT (NUDIX family)
MAMKKFFVGVKAIIYDETRGVLLLRDPRIVDVPGGRIDDNESYEETLRREISEELPGTEVKSVGKLVGTYKLPFDIKDDTGLVLLFFRVEAKVPEQVILSDEHEEFIWARTIQDIPETGLNDEIRRIITNIIS